MVDRPPPSRYSVVERGGRLVVIDRESGSVPPTAAERMAEHDRRMGHERVRPTPRQSAPEPAQVRKAAQPARTSPPPPRDRRATAFDPDTKRPWTDTKKAAAESKQASSATRPQAPTMTATANIQRKTIVTVKWWDAKGPRTVELGPNGQQILSSRFLMLFFVIVIAAIIALIVEPVLLFIGIFLLFQFGGKLLGPIGAGIIDRASAEKG